jgi:hypothetical protein
MKRIILALVLALVPLTLDAQTTKRLAWDMNTSPAVAQGYRYRLFVNGTEQPDLLVASCAESAAGATCSVPMPALTPGPVHTLELTAIEPVNGLESARSAPFPVSIPVIPSNLRVQ